MTPAYLSGRKFLYLFSSFTGAKTALLIGRTSIILFAFQWLETEKLAVLLGILSLIEILRSIADFGTEHVIYSRLSSKEDGVPKTVEYLIKLRLLTSLIIFTPAILTCFLWDNYSYWPLTFLILIGAIQSSCIAFIQKQRAFLKMLNFVVAVCCVALVAASMALFYELEGCLLAFTMIVPELFAALYGYCMTRDEWKRVSRAKVKVFSIGARFFPYLLPSMGVSFLVVLYTRLDIVLVFPLLGNLAQSEYSIAFRLVEPIYLILSLLSLTFLAELGGLKTAQSRLLTRKLYKIMNSAVLIKMLIVAITLGGIVKWFSVSILNLSELSSWVVFLLVLAIPIKVYNSFLTSILQRTGYYITVLHAAGLTLIFTLLFGGVFGLISNIVGIAVAVIVAEIINMTYQKRKVRAILFGMNNDVR